MDATIRLTPSDLARPACKVLQDQATGVVKTPQQNSFVSKSQNCWLPAAYCVRPRNTDEVAAVLGTLKKLEVKFAIWSTGRYSNVNSNSVDGSGVFIDLRDSKSLSLDERDGTLRAGGGSTWGMCAPFSKSVGVQSSSGMSAFPNIHGLPADGVKNFEVVLGDTSVMNANSETNPDLWRVLKGDGTNFGIVTRFDFETYPLIKTKYTVNLYDPANYVNILRATVEVQESMESDPKIGLFVSFNPTFIVVGLLYADAPVEVPSAFDPFLNLKSLTATAVPWADGTIVSLVASIQFNPPSARRTQSVTSTKVSLDHYLKVHELWLEANKTAVAEISYTIQPLASSAVTEGEWRGGNIVGIEKLAQNWYAFAGFWSDPGLDEEGIRNVDDLQRGAEQVAKSSGDHLRFQLMTDGGPLQTVLESYGPDNLGKIREAATKYDPGRVFQVLQNGGNLLRRLLRCRRLSGVNLEGFAHSKL
ncbi:6-hydroxy-D-nicotine oxidase [Hypoxylon fuscum]|nr:6-hydroxy-D-nicotine oxidase [Hypoxylon fuscum]